MKHVFKLSLLFVLIVTEVICDCKPSETCISLRSCPPLLALLRNLTTYNRDYLRRSQCLGFVGNVPNMCCPSLPQIATPRVTAPRVSPRAADVSRHGNLRLINSRSCGVGETSQDVDGVTADLYEFPWMAQLGYRDTRGGIKFSCGGSLINSLYVLTAAHCINPSLTTVRLGEYDTTQDPDCEEVYGGRLCADPVQDIAVNATFSHPGYLGFPLTNDIALIRLGSPATLGSDSVKPVCLPVGDAQQERNLLGTTMVISGWGISDEGSESAIQLRQQLPIVTNNECHMICNSRLGHMVTERQLCVGVVAGGCGVDSGGPLVAVDNVKYVQWGVASAGVKRCGTDDVPAVYTRVGYYMKWILDTILP